VRASNSLHADNSTLRQVANPALDTARELVERQKPVFALHTPSAARGCSCKDGAACRTPGKHPRWHPDDLPNGHLSATTDPATIDTWAARWPRANWAMPTGGVSGVVVFEVDARNGGLEALEALEAELGPLPETVQAISGSGGPHFYLAHPGEGIKIKCSAGELAPGVDVRGDGGLVVLPGSLHKSGRRYEWEISSHPADVALAPIPPAWLARLTATTPTKLGAAKGRALGEDDPIGEGRRNSTLTRMGGAMRRVGMGEEEIAAGLLAVNERRCDPPLPEAEVKKIAASMTRYAPDPDGDAPTLRLVPPAAPDCPELAARLAEAEREIAELKATERMVKDVIGNPKLRPNEKVMAVIVSFELAAHQTKKKGEEHPDAGERERLRGFMKVSRAGLAERGGCSAQTAGDLVGRLASFGVFDKTTARTFNADAGEWRTEIYLRPKAAQVSEMLRPVTTLTPERPLDDKGQPRPWGGRRQPRAQRECPDCGDAGVTFLAYCTGCGRHLAGLDTALPAEGAVQESQDDSPNVEPRGGAGGPVQESQDDILDERRPVTLLGRATGRAGRHPPPRAVGGGDPLAAGGAL
jgi:hypothetical protein